ncbi:hypothetical protein K4K59_009203 [Colletotrichum sp. SAR11_240]|nr:hypothetical protein K4K59_009203 [Colletotrichum sp. SAR11_240]
MAPTPSKVSVPAPRTGCTLRDPRKPRPKPSLGYDLVIVQINLKNAPDPPRTIGTWSSPDYNVAFKPARDIADREGDDFDTGEDPMPVESVAFYVHRSINPTDWEVDWWLDDEDNEGLVATLRLNTAMGPIKIHNIYNRNKAVNFRTLLSPSTLGPMSVLLGDWNECHPDWAGRNATSSGPNADVLAILTRAAGMVLKLAPNTPTYHRSLANREDFSTIDLVWVSQDLNTRTRKAQVLDASDRMDHAPIGAFTA